MKKIAILSALFCAMTAAHAENVVEVVPFATQAGVVSDDGATFELTLTNETCQAGIIVFDMYLPAGLDLDLSYDVDGAENTAVEIIKDRTKYKEGRSEKETGHQGAYNFIGLEDGFNHYRVVISSAGDVPLQGTSGAVANFYYVTDAGMADGVYPIYVRAAELTNVKAMTMETFAAATSYVTIGSPKKVSNFAVEGILPSFVTSALCAEEGLNEINLSNATEVNGDFTYVAGRKVVAPASDVNASVKFDAPLAGTYGSFCAPVDVNVDCYTLTSCDGTTAVFTPATTAPAGTPVLIDKAVKTVAQAARLTTVEGRQITAGYYVAADGSSMRSVNSTATIPALRGAWEDIVASSNLRIAIETPTGIQYIGTADEVFGNTYDLQGRQVQEAHNGVFVVNGKKQFVK